MWRDPALACRLTSDGELGYPMRTGADCSASKPVPMLLCAVTPNLYDVPFDNPPTVHAGIDGFTGLHVAPPGVDDTVYPSIGAPPSKGATHETVASPSPGSAITSTTESGCLAGTVAAAVPAGPIPKELRALTEKVYSVPFVNPNTSHDKMNGENELHPAPSGDAVTV